MDNSPIIKPSYYQSGSSGQQPIEFTGMEDFSKTYYNNIFTFLLLLLLGDQNNFTDVPLGAAAEAAETSFIEKTTIETKTSLSNENFAKCSPKKHKNKRRLASRY